MDRIGFMQGRLVDQIEGRIQAFPWNDWQLEFARAAELKLSSMEWTLDDPRMSENPFMIAEGQRTIKELSAQTGVRVNSLTGDCFMQAPFWKAGGSTRSALLEKLDLILRSAANLGVKFVVLPLVDAGRLETDEQRELLIAELLRRHPSLQSSGTQIIFETDYDPGVYAQFLSRLPKDSFNVNYDIGNSASLGFDPTEEFAAYGARIVNVHVKDRKRGGTTVPLGTGSADFDLVFKGLASLGYAGNFILQTARAPDGDHARALRTYMTMTQQWIERYYGS
jgi:L-ribulose-5-phosphate 3-epimerase